MIEKDQSPTALRTRKRWRNRPTQWTPNHSSKKHPNTNHFLSQCTFLPDNDRRFMVKAKQIVSILDNEQDADGYLDPDRPAADTTMPRPDVVAYRVQTRQFPYMDVFHGHRVLYGKPQWTKVVKNWYWSFEICSRGSRFFWPVEKFFHESRILLPFYSAVSSFSAVWLKPYTNRSCLGSSIVLFTGTVIDL